MFKFNPLGSVFGPLGPLVALQTSARLQQLGLRYLEIAELEQKAAQRLKKYPQNRAFFHAMAAQHKTGLRTAAGIELLKGFGINATP